MSSSIRLHRVLPTTSGRLYGALLSPQRLARWLPRHGFTHIEHKTDAWVGGTFQTHFTMFSTGVVHAFGGQYLELIPNKLLRFTDVTGDPLLSGKMVTTLFLKPVPGGTELAIRQEGIPKAIPPEARYMGWHESLLLLSMLALPSLPDLK